MSVRIEPTGRRSVQVEVEVPGTPDEVWQAIATGPGVSAWFVPTDVTPATSDNYVGGAVTSHFGAGMDAVATITAWDAPHRFAADSSIGPNAPTFATEWTVEARGGGRCVVRVVHSLFADTADWDDQLTGVESGWPAFFLILRLYLEHFRGEPCTRFQLTAFPTGTCADVWARVISALGLSGAIVGERRNASAEAPPLSGTVEAVHEGEHPHLLLRLDLPAPGAAILNSCAAGDKAFLTVSFYLYGASAAGVAARAEPQWSAWFASHFPQ